MTKRDHAYRPSDPHSAYVRRADGTMVRNLAYTGEADRRGHDPLRPGRGRSGAGEDSRARRRASKIGRALRGKHRDGVPQPELDDTRTELNRIQASLHGPVQDLGSDAAYAVMERIANGEPGGTISVNCSVPTSGFCWSPYPERELIVPAGDIGAQTIHDYAKANEDVLQKDGHYLGYWIDDGKCYLDISVVGDDAAEVRRSCEKSDQYAFYDLAAEQSCQVLTER